MPGIILPGDGNGEHSLPGPGMPFRGWTEGRPRDSAGERWRGPDGYDFRRGPRVLILSCIPTTLGILLRPFRFYRLAAVRMSKSPGGPE